MPAVLKTAEPQGSVSSNLTLSAKNKKMCLNCQKDVDTR